MTFALSLRPLLRPLRGAFVAAAVLSAAPLARAEVLPIPQALWAGAVPATPGHGTQMLFVHAAFGGYPNSLADARLLLEGRSLTPAFDVFCGITPYVDFTNATVADSEGRQEPTVLCLPFIDPERAAAGAKCRELPTFPQGRYFTGGGAGLRVAGYLAIREAGTYTFAWGHDDGFGMTLGDVEVFSYVDPTGSRVDYRAVQFPRAGLYPFQLDWFDGGGGALIDWYIAPGEHVGERLSSAGFALVAPEDLYPSGALPCTARCERCPASAPRCDYDHSRCYACDANEDCADCEACDQGRCRPAREVPDASLPARCTASPDAGEAPADAAIDASTDRDASLDAARPPAAAELSGCACGVTSVKPARAWLEFALAALAFTRRRRASCQQRRSAP